MTYFGVLLVCLPALIAESSAARPRGVRPDLASFYNPSSSFKCLDGSAEIPFDQVNDDYCDCKDGSDEPGTSACSNGVFYCSNVGFRPTLNPSSRVNDGICDCCDGSDEWALVAGSPCANNCDEMGAAERAERERLEKVVVEGLKLKAEMQQQGIQMKSEKENDISVKRLELEKLNAEKEAKKLVKDEAESAEKAALDVIREEEDRVRQEKEEKERLEKEAEALQYFQLFDRNQDGQVTQDELQARVEFDQNNDGQVSDEEAKFYLSGNDSYDQETFVSTGWLLIKHLFSKFEKKPVPVKSQAETTEGTDEDYDYDALDDHDGDDDVDDALEAPSTDEPHHEDTEEKEASPPSQYSPEVQALVDAANAARQEYDIASKAYNDLNNDIQQLQKYLEKDLGPDQAFATLVNQCFELNDLEYTYKLCAFDYAAQKPLHGGSETRLGSWERWSQPHTQMSYERGAQCWNGPQRSTKVDLRCGAENKLVATSEPSKCEYLFLFETPAACHPLEPTQRTLFGRRKLSGSHCDFVNFGNFQSQSLLLLALRKRQPKFVDLKLLRSY